jgi:outer membrane receptor protein involved in Fe transport
VLQRLASIPLALLALVAHAESDAARAMEMSLVQVTATRFGEPVPEVPMAISVITGESLRARGATDLRTALSEIAGVSIAPGGDAGPAGSVPGLLGVREVDDLLLLIDGIPAGGAFIPQLEAVSMTNVERIEVLRGSAPVYFGTTAFAGTINVIHYAAGKADRNVDARVGSYGSWSLAGAAALSSDGLRQSVSAELGDEKLSDPRAGIKRAQGTWRGATEIGSASLRLDAKALWLRQKPTSPTALDPQTGQLTTLLPIDYNENPADTKLDTNRYQLGMGYDQPLGWGAWGSTIAYTATQTDSIRGFLDLADTPQPWTPATVADIEAFSQSLRLRELFVDTHVTTRPLTELDLTAGVNLLAGHSHAYSLRYAYPLPLDGISPPPSTQALSPKTDVDFSDDRRLLGLYAQGLYRMTSSSSLLVGLRWNDTHETRDEHRRSTRTGSISTFDSEPQDNRRLSGSLGVRWQALRNGGGAVDSLIMYASVGNTFQLPQVDFGPSPEARPEGTRLLEPETQHSLIASLRGVALDGRAEFDIDGFYVDFDNQPVTANVDGSPVLRSGGKQRYRGIDLEGKLFAATSWTLTGSIGWSDARYRDFVTDVDGTPTQLAGKRLVLTPLVRGGAGVVYAPAGGWRGALTATYVGEHYLDSLNTARAPAYAIVDGSIGFRFERCTLQLSATNIGDKRPAVQVSELGEGQFYRLPGRRFTLTLTTPLP